MSLAPVSYTHLGSIVVSVMALYIFDSLEGAPVVDLSNVEVNLNNTMIGKKVIVVANLKPAKLRGVESQGMILAGSKKKVLELATVQSLPNGTKIR